MLSVNILIKLVFHISNFFRPCLKRSHACLLSMEFTSILVLSFLLDICACGMYVIYPVSLDRQIKSVTTVNI